MLILTYHMSLLLVFAFISSSTIFPFLGLWVQTPQEKEANLIEPG